MAIITAFPINGKTIKDLDPEESLDSAKLLFIGDPATGLLTKATAAQFAALLGSFDPSENETITASLWDFHNNVHIGSNKSAGIANYDTVTLLGDWNGRGGSTILSIDDDAQSMQAWADSFQIWRPTGYEEGDDTPRMVTSFGNDGSIWAANGAMTVGQGGDTDVYSLAVGEGGISLPTGDISMDNITLHDSGAADFANGNFTVDEGGNLVSQGGLDISSDLNVNEGAYIHTYGGGINVNGADVNINSGGSLNIGSNVYINDDGSSKFNRTQITSDGDLFQSSLSESSNWYLGWNSDDTAYGLVNDDRSGYVYYFDVAGFPDSGNMYLNSSLIIGNLLEGGNPPKAGISCIDGSGYLSGGNINFNGNGEISISTPSYPDYFFQISDGQVNIGDLGPDGNQTTFILSDFEQNVSVSGNGGTSLSLDTSNGSGYLCNENISWDDGGNLTVNGFINTGSGISLGSDGSIQNNNVIFYPDGSGYLAGSNVSWDSSGHITAPTLKLSDTVSRNYANDSAAATAGVPVGGIYHTSGTLKIRLS